MNIDQINAYIGQPWLAGARGPDAWDCWGLLLHLQVKYFGHALPELPTGDGQARAVYQGKLACGAWQPVEQPQHGDGVLMRGGDDPHVGVWLAPEGGGVLHAVRGAGVVWTRQSDLRRQGYSRVKFHRFHELRDADPLP